LIHILATNIQGLIDFN